MIRQTLQREGRGNERKEVKRSEGENRRREKGGMSGCGVV
jgi:hypothetical protein